jgi:Ricin-type beta-trefoil lectin domain
VTLDSTDGVSPSDMYILVTWSMYCTEGSAEGTTMNPTTNPPVAISQSSAVTVNLGFASTTPTPDSCIVQSLVATLQAGSSAATAVNATSGSFSMDLTYTPGSGSSSSSSSSAPPTTTHVATVSGYDGKCVDDRGNSSSNRAQVIIWSCNSSDSAQGWSFSGGELKHNSHCANIQGNGGSGSKLILWSCNGASNEKWFHSSSDGEYVSAGTAHGLLCMDDPGYSKTNGTQLIVYKCHNTSNQHWSA